MLGKLLFIRNSIPPVLRIILNRIIRFIYLEKIEVYLNIQFFYLSSYTRYQKYSCCINKNLFIMHILNTS